MPDCKACQWFSKAKQDCTISGPIPAGDCQLRKCVLAILQKHLPHWSGKVLEIGYGMRRQPRKMLRNRAEWHGAEPRFPTNEKTRQYQCTVSKMPFVDAMFRHVLATETMEHWAEYGESVKDGLREIARVLEPGGTILVTVPIHLHGSNEFLHGDLHAIEHHFDPKLWRDYKTEHWREDYGPLPVPLDIRAAWPKLRKSDKHALQEAHGYSSWTLEITAIRR